ncbi:hypothetical protein CL653_03425 [bacterium]|nr:hypothetical protein [bacterium]
MEVGSHKNGKYYQRRTARSVPDTSGILMLNSLSDVLSHEQYYIDQFERAGFHNIHIVDMEPYQTLIRTWNHGEERKSYLEHKAFLEHYSTIRKMFRGHIIFASNFSGMWGTDDTDSSRSTELTGIILTNKEDLTLVENYMPMLLGLEK